MKNNRPKLRLIWQPELSVFDSMSVFKMFNPNYTALRTIQKGIYKLKVFAEKLQNGKSYYNGEPPEAFKPTPVYRRKRKPRLKPKTNLKRYFELKKIEHWF